MVGKTSIPEMIRMKKEFSPCWSQYAFLTEDDKEKFLSSQNNGLTRFSSKTCPFDNRAGLIPEKFSRRMTTDAMAVCGMP